MTNAHKLPEVTEQSFDAEVLRAKGTVMVDFTAEWCGPCRALEPLLHQVAVENEGRVKVTSVNGDTWPELAARYGVRGFPTVVVFENGVEVGRQIGLTSKSRLLSLLNR